MIAATLRKAFCGATLLSIVVNCSPVPPYLQRQPYSRHNISVSLIASELGPQLSSSASIFGPDSPEWANATTRWNTIAPPDVEVVVAAGVESDIPTINSLEFLAVNRGHGFTTSLHRFKGVEIDLKQLTAISVNTDTQTALMQGGVYGTQVIATLWDYGYYTTTGSNECVGLVGPGLGGGHGRLEGLYGLVLDNIIHMNVILANGSTIAVNATSHPDLFWAMRGAGHNYGIVSSFEMKIYPRASPTWHWHNYYYSQDKLEAVFEALNSVQDGGRTPPKWGASYFQISFNQTMSATEPVLWLTISYNGPAAEAEPHFAPFNAIPALSTDQGDVPYPEIVVPQDTGTSSCGGGNFAISSILLQTYNTTTQRQLYNLLVERAAMYPDLATYARLYHEGYGVAGMQAIDPASTAYPHRSQNHLAFFLAAVPDNQPNLTAPAEQWARDSFNLWTAGEPTKPDALYVNYASGAPWESLPAIYGRDDGRLQRLDRVKAQYDPHNRFAYYVPLVDPGRR